MNLTLTGLLIAAFVAPGVIFFITPYLVSKHLSIRDINTSFVGISYSIIISMIYHALALITILERCNPFYECSLTMGVQKLFESNPQSRNVILGVGELFFNNIYGVFGYLIISLIIPGLLAGTLLRLIEKGFLDVPFMHGWAYPYIKGDPVVLANVLTRISTADNSRRVIYTGFLDELKRDKNGKIIFVSLNYPLKKYLVLGRKKIFIDESSYGHVHNTRNLQRYEGDSKTINKKISTINMIIDGEDIDNIVLERLEVEELEALNKIRSQQSDDE